MPRDCFGTRMATVQPMLGMASGTLTFNAQPNSLLLEPTFQASTVSNVVHDGALHPAGTLHVSFGSIVQSIELGDSGAVAGANPGG